MDNLIDWKNLLFMFLLFRKLSILIRLRFKLNIKLLTSIKIHNII